MSVAVMFIVMFALLFLGVPIGISIACAMFSLLALNPVTTTQFVAQSMYSGLSSFTLIALPFFILSGTIMESGGLSRRMINVADALVGNVTGSLGMVTIIACMFFGAVSGSAIATVAAIGGIMLPAMAKAGYDKVYATALTTVAGCLGFIVPPSTPMVIYGITNRVSIGAMFMAGFLPALVVGGLLMLVNYVYCKKHNLVGSGHRFSLRNVARQFWLSKWALLMPVIILGGIYGGFMTPTESAVIACFYGIVVGKYVYKELTFKRIWHMFKDNTSFIGAMMFTFAPAGALSSIFAYLKVPTAIAGFFFSISTNKYVILLLIFILLVIVGMLLETTPAILLITPILLPVVEPLGIDPIHFGIFCILVLCIGLVTPPVAMGLFVAQSMTGISMMRIAKKAIPFMLALAVSCAIIGLFPEISLIIPRLSKYI